MNTTTHLDHNGALLAAIRHRLGYSLTELADVLNVHPRTLRAWITERDPLPVGVLDELAELLGEHDADVADALDAGEVVIPHESPMSGWWTAVAAEAIGSGKDVAIIWDE